MTTTSLDNNNNSSFLESYQQQISLLEQNPNATSAYDQGLEQEFAAVRAQLEGGDCNPAAGQSQPPNLSGSGPIGNSTGTSMPSPNSSSNDNNGPVNGGSPVSSGGELNTSNLPPALQKLVPDIEAAAKASGVNPNLIAAQIWQESRGNVGATSTNPGNAETDTGLMQINPATFASLQQQYPELQGKSLDDPATNILAGALLMKGLEQQYGGNADLALRAYNSGPNSVDPSNANITTTGLGDPNYVSSVDSVLSDIENGQSLPA
jgi:soluble lytic murein transglycosylase-like protein